MIRARLAILLRRSPVAKRGTKVSRRGFAGTDCGTECESDIDRSQPHSDERPPIGAVDPEASAGGGSHDHGVGGAVVRSG